MLTERLGLPSSGSRLFAHGGERWDGKGIPVGPGVRRSPCPCESFTWLGTPRSRACWAAPSLPLASIREGGGNRSGGAAAP
jgi:hypothetical protein